MMKYKYSYQFNDIDKISYDINENIIKCICNGVEEIFDFSDITEDGKLDNLIIENIQINPIISQEIKDGILYVNLLMFYDSSNSKIIENNLSYYEKVVEN